MNNFSNDLRQRTKNIHEVAETTGFNKRLTDGNATTESYGEYIYNFLPVYEAIEKSLMKLQNNERIAPLVTKELFKAELIKKDIEFILGDKVKDIEILESTKAYVKRIEEMAESNPIAVIAHGYTRFLADLFGGRTFDNLLSNKYGIDKEGLHYYEMDKSIPEIMPYVMGYHQKLAALNLSEEEAEIFINESVNSYIYNIGISTELEVKLFKEKVEDRGHTLGRPAGHPAMGGHPGAGHPGMGHPGGHPHN